MNYTNGQVYPAFHTTGKFLNFFITYFGKPKYFQ